MQLLFFLQLSAILLIFLLDGQACVEIFGGKEAKPHSRPYMVYIKKEKPKFCGGILINPHWVLTAAHCNVKCTDSIILGAHSISANDKTKQVRKISRVITYEKYKKETLDNDVALLKLSKKATTTYAVKPLPLPGSCKEPVKGTACAIAGWGITSNNTPSDKLKEANVTIIGRKACDAHWKTIKITKNMICTSDKGKREACTGDSGGPLICKGVLRGITSFGNLICGIRGSVSVYANLNCKILNWIKNQLKGLP